MNFVLLLIVALVGVEGSSPDRTGLTTSCELRETSSNLDESRLTSEGVQWNSGLSRKTIRLATTQPIVGSPVKDPSGMVVKANEVLDLSNGTITITKPIVVYGEIRNGFIDARGLAKYEGAVYFPKDSTGSSFTNVKVIGGSYNGAIKVWGNDCRISNGGVMPGTGWGVQVLGAHRGVIDGWYASDTDRGGIYFGDGTEFGTSSTCDDWQVKNVTLLNSKYEAVFRSNRAKRLRVVDSFFDNTSSLSGKEAVQPRGLDMVFERCVILAGSSSGQTPVGQSQTSTVVFKDCTIYGYNSIEAGGFVTFTSSLLVHQPSFTYNGKTYKLKTPGNNRCVNPQSAARGLPDGKAIVDRCTVRGELTNAPSKVTVKK